MPLNQIIIDELRCCLDENEHIVVEPILLKCGRNGCKDCIKKSNESEIQCHYCKEKHSTKDLLDSSVNKIADVLVNSSLPDLFDYLEAKLKLAMSALTGKSLIEEFDSKMIFVENAIDIRVESMITQIQVYRDDCLSKLKKFKQEFEKSLKEDKIVTNGTQIENENSKSLTLQSFKEKQNFLKVYRERLKVYEEKFEKYKFIPSDFTVEKEHLGELMGSEGAVSWLNTSLILTQEECCTLENMLSNCVNGSILYRATRDGFEASKFHATCDGKENTVTIIKNNFNYVFGGYTSAKWASEGKWISDAQAFIFSLRRNGVSNNNKFLPINSSYAIYGHPNCGPAFGGGREIHVRDRADVNLGSYSNFSTLYYERPSNAEDKNAFLAGMKEGWLVSEIEVYQLDKKK